MKVNRVFGVMLGVMMVVPAVYGVDGIILIDQNRALAGNVTPGDGPGFPVTISQPGSYKLSGNLSVPSTVRAIEITVPDVTIDLNGFSITTPWPQSQTSPSRGIFYNGSTIPANIAIRNGTIEGFLVPIQLISATIVKCQACSFEDLILRSNFGGSVSFDLGNNIRMHKVTAPDSDINVLCPSVITETVARAISQGFLFPGDPNPPNVGACTFAHNATQF